jgi:nitrous oxide reductase
MRTQPSNDREAKEESHETPDRRDFLKAAVVAAAGAAAPAGAAWAGSNQGVQTEGSSMNIRKLGGLSVPAANI